MTGRYERLVQVPWWSHSRVRTARALVVGAGALGGEVAKNLALAGWGTLVVVDRAAVAESDLGRSVLFRRDDVGTPRAAALAAGVRRVNPDVRTVALDGDLRTIVGAGLLARVDVVFGCLDNVEGRTALAQLVARAGRLHLDGTLSTGEGTARVFDGGGGPCYGCGLSPEDLRDLTLAHPTLAQAERASESDRGPSIPPLASAIGAFMSQQALTWLHRDAPGTAVRTGREIRWDTAHDRFWTTALRVNPDCPIHTRVPPVQPQLQLPAEISWAEICAQARSLTGAGTVLHLPTLVLHRWECPLCRAAGYHPPVAQTGHESFACPRCGGEARPRRARQVTGTELWATASPRSTGCAAWTWIDAHGEKGWAVIELTGTVDDLAMLD